MKAESLWYCWLNRRHVNASFPSDPYGRLVRQLHAAGSDVRHAAGHLLRAVGRLLCAAAHPQGHIRAALQVLARGQETARPRSDSSGLAGHLESLRHRARGQNRHGCSPVPHHRPLHGPLLHLGASTRCPAAFHPHLFHRSQRERYSGSHDHPERASPLPPVLCSCRLCVDRLFVVLLYIYINEGELYVIWEQYVILRRVYFTSNDFLKSNHTRTLLLTNVPVLMQNREIIKKFIAPIVPKSVLIGRDFGKLQEMFVEHKVIALKLEKVLAKYLKDPYNIPVRRPRHKEGAFLGYLGGENVDSLSFYGDKINKLSVEIYKIRTQPNESFKSTSSAFIIFDSINEAHIAAKKLSNIKNKVQSQLTGIPSVKLCPNYEDIIWENISIPLKQKWIRQLLSFVITIGLIVGWTFLTSFTYSLDNLERWKAIPGIGQYITSSKSATVFIQSYLVPIITIVLNLLLPFVLLMLAKLQGITSNSGVEKSALVRFFSFMVFQFIVYIGAGVVESLIRGVVNNNNGSTTGVDFFTVLGKGFVSGSTHFMIIAVTGYAGFSLDMIQIFPFIMRYYNKVICATPREEHMLNESMPFDYMRTYAVLLFTFFNCAAYLLVAPLMCLFAFIFFWLAYIFLKYQLHYVFETKMESGGLWFPKVFLLLCLSMIGFQITTFAAVVIIAAYPSANYGSTNGKNQSAAIITLAVITLVYYFGMWYFMAPKAEYASVFEDREMGHAFGENGVAAEGRIYNPAMVKPLTKIWVRPNQTSQLDSFYQPAYNDLLDYTRQNAIGSYARVKAEQAGVLQRLRTLTSSALALNVEIPPEMREYDDDTDTQNGI